MSSRHGQRAHKQNSHEPECIVQNRVLGLVMMSCVGQVTGELPMRTRMTVLAGFDDILMRQSRVRVVGRQDVMSTMAVGALGRRRVAQLGHLSMECIEIRFGHVFMAMTAMRHDFQLKISLVGGRNRMRLMAVVTDRKLLFAVGDIR